MGSQRRSAARARGIWLPAAAGALSCWHDASAAGLLSAPSASTTLDLSITGLLRDTDALVRAVLLVLLLASVLSWTIWVAKSIELARSRRRLAADVRVLNATRGLGALSALTSAAGLAVLEAIRAELARAGDLRQSASAEGLKERVTVRLMSVESGFAQRMSAGVNIVASIGSTAPFVGLFGTVWGIMASFIGIARSQATNLAAVAPGIAEALLTTAVGLAAAVPAVLIYNAFTRSIAGYRVLLAEVSNAAACLLSLEIERLQVEGMQTARGEGLKEARGGL